MADFARSDDPAVQAQLDRLAILSPGADSLGLERITALLERLGRPQDRLPPVFHVAGTNGKGSTCAFLRAGLEATGARVHMFTSPHLVRYNERIRLAGRLIEDKLLAELLAEALDAGDGIGASFFEVTTAVALLAFARTSADACIVEVGLGGRLDATNVIERPLVTGIASIGLDHQQWLGSSLAEIAAEKAGIAKRGVPLLFGHYSGEVAEVIARVGEAAGAQLYPAPLRWHYEAANERLQYRDAKGAVTVPLPTLEGPHQIDNCALALAMLRHQDRIEMPIEELEHMPLEARWPARMQRLEPGPLAQAGETWVDGAHNPEAAEALAAVLAKRGPMHLVIGILANKDADAIVERLAPHALSLTFVPVPGHAHHDPDAMVERFAGRTARSLEEAIAATLAPRLIVGSLYLAGKALKANAQLPD